MITKEEEAQLERARQRLINGYEGKLRGVGFMLAGAMRTSYAAGQADSLNMISKEGFEITRKAEKKVPSDAV